MGRLKLLRFDLDVGATLLLRLWSILAGIGTVVAVSIWLSPVEQGYYFTFASVLALQVFFDLGLNAVLTQFVARHMGGVRLLDGARLTGDTGVQETLGALLRHLTRLYALLAVLYFGFVGAGGAWFFAASTSESPPGWLASWWLLTFCAAGNVFLSPILAIHEGAGMLARVARLRTVQSIVGSIAAWVAMGLGAGLMAVPLVAASSFAGTLFWLRRNPGIVGLIRTAPRVAHKFRWRRDILPFQWRIALSWMSGYLLFQLFNPVVFRYHGPVQAGQIGLALSIFTALGSLSLSWVGAKAPALAMRIGEGRHADARRLFWNQFRIGVAVNVTMISTLLAVVLLARAVELPYTDRLPHPWVLASLAVFAVANNIVAALAVLIRAHGTEPLVLPSVVAGLLSAAVLFLATPYGLGALAALAAAVQVFVCLPWVGAIFYVHYWHHRKPT